VTEENWDNCIGMVRAYLHQFSPRLMVGMVHNELSQLFRWKRRVQVVGINALAGAERSKNPPFPSTPDSAVNISQHA